jgi:hypothetical protein
VAATDQIGGEAIITRIRKHMDGSEYVREAGLTLSTSYRLLGEVKRHTSESMDDFVEKVAANIQQFINDEIDSRKVGNAD